MKTPPVPSIGLSARLVLKLGPIRDRRRPCTIRIGCAPSAGPAPAVFAGGRPCGAPLEDATREGMRRLSFAVPPEALPDTGICRIVIVSGDGSAVTIERIDLFLEGR